jgi:outer membrane protein assembly factor BamB
VAASQSPTVPPPTGPYDQAWTRSLDTDRPLGLVAGSGLVYVFAAAGPIVARHFEDGREAWSRPLASDWHPVVGDDLLFLYAAGQLSALAADTGAVRWAKTLPRATAPPLARSGWLVVAAGQSVRAFRAADGSAVWERDLGGPVTRAIAIEGAQLFVAVGDTELQALDIETGRTRWVSTLEQPPAAIFPFRDRVYFSTGPDPFLFVACGQRDGRVNWTAKTGSPTIGEPDADERNVYVALLDNTLRALDREGGTERWKTLLTARPASGPIVAGGHLVLPMRLGELMIVDVKTGRRAGRLEVVRSPDQPADVSFSLEAWAATENGGRLFRITVASDETRTLSAFTNRLLKEPAP